MESRRQRVFTDSLAGEIRVRVEQDMFTGVVRRLNRCRHACVQFRKRPEWALIDDGFRHPGGVLENAAERRNKLCAAGGIKLV